MELQVSFEAFKRSPQPLKAGIVAIVVSRRFIEFNMYSQRCIIVGTVVACSAGDLIRPIASPYMSPCTLANPKGEKSWGPRRQSPKQHTRSLITLLYMCVRPGRQDTLGCTRDKTRSSCHSGPLREGSACTAVKRKCVTPVKRGGQKQVITSVESASARLDSLRTMMHDWLILPN